ncbi:hypothetical protein ACVWZD_000892 [Streptomyces sp. TE3672]
MAQPAAAATYTVNTYPAKYGHVTYSTSTGALTAYDDYSDNHRVIAVLRNPWGDEVAYSEDTNGANGTPGATDRYFGISGDVLTVYVCSQSGANTSTRDMCNNLDINVP